MARRFTTVMIALCCYFGINNISAQITGLKFLLKYDTTTCLYNVNIVITEGTAVTVPQRTQFNAQITLIVPSTDSMEIVQRFMPLESNQFYTGTNPLVWAISTTLFEPCSQPGSNFYSISPALSPTSQYNNTTVGDTIKLFSVRAFRKDGSAVLNCGGNLRFFENDTDPNSSACGMMGGDFKNGFTIGGIGEDYEGNLTTIRPPEAILNYQLNCSDDIDINLISHSRTCQLPLSYSWTGPGYFSTLEDVLITPASSFNSGQYNVTVTDALGCTSTLSIDAEKKPEAGSDKDLCGIGNIMLNGSNPTTGIWTALGTNPAGATLGATSGGNATVNFVAGSDGVYKFVYSSALCSDTMDVNVSPSLNATISGLNNVCNGSTTTLTAGGGTGYVWSNGNLTSSVTVGAGSYSVTVTDAAGCTGTAIKTITNLPVVNATISGLDNVCNGSSTTLTASGGTGYVWSNGNLTSSVTVGAGSYSVTVTDAAGCTDTEIKTITNLPVVNATISGLNNVCNGSTTTVTAGGGTGYVWSNGNLTSSVTVGAGSYSVTVTDAAGCTDMEIKTITNLPVVNATIAGSGVVCAGGCTTFTAGGGTSYVWCSGVLIPAINVSTAGNYTVI
ncbi:MAG: hypothetical protein H7X99_11670, partial [Saprospiraceae bacterium]|nr:hypothetical protein [Saprospiraceae bacterium]